MSADTLALTGKVAIVTGSGRENGIGAGIVRALARNGAAVTINCVSDATVGRAVAFSESLRAEGYQLAVVQADVTTPEGAKSLVEGTLKAFNADKIDILVNNSGFGTGGPTLDHKVEDIDKMLNVNIKGTILMAQATVPLMPYGGRVINISSSASKRGEQSIPVYGAAKAAIDSLTWSWAAEWGRTRGITVNAIGSGPVITDMAPPPVEEMLYRPMRDATRTEERYGTIQDIGDSVLLLVSEKARWISGQYIGVNGGLTGYKALDVGIDSNFVTAIKHWVGQD